LSDNTFPTPDELRFAADVVERVHADCPRPHLMWSSAYGLRAEATRIEVQRDREIEVMAEAMERGVWADSYCYEQARIAHAALDKLRGDRGE